MQSEIKRMWEIFAIHANSVLELRALSPTNKLPVVLKFRGKNYATTEELKSAFEEKALELNIKGFNTYIVMNPIDEAIINNSVKDIDIACRRLLLVDIDRAQKAKSPATEEELKSARLTAMQIKNFTTSLGFSEPVVVMSGNGYHLYYRLDDLPNNDESTRLISKTLQNLARKFNNNSVHIDTSVSNASRITKIPGTVAYKGISESDRPFRKAVIV